MSVTWPPALEHPTLTVCILGQNQAAHLGPLLAQAASLADEIVYVDSGSTDESEALVRRQPKARFFVRPLEGHFGRQRNYAIEQARGDWILFLDTDELLGPHLISLLPALLRSRFRSFNSPTYWLASEDPPLFVRAPGLYPNRHLRLFRREERVRYAEDRPVHERIPFDAARPCFRLQRAHILHYCFCWLSRAEREAKVARYRGLAEQNINRFYLYEDLPHRLCRCREGWLGGRPFNSVLDCAWNRWRLRVSQALRLEART